MLGRGRSVVIDDFRRLDVYGPDGHVTRKYRGGDKGHAAELRVFADLVRGRREPEPVAQSAFRTSEVALIAVEAASTGETIRNR